MLPKNIIEGDIAIQVNGISKAYRIGLEELKHDTLGSAIVSFFKKPFKNLKRLKGLSKFNGFESKDIYWANKDITFNVKKGEVLGIIGKNGAGKSTLLKILSKITDPTEGQILIKGKVASLLEVGTGFNPELTGRENIYLNGTILGMTKKEIDSKFNEIIEFSGIPKFIDTPVKRYSSGMKVRLAFAVAAFLEPDILIVDEVLAVGDAEFQKKCLGKMKEISGNNGRTVLFVSHDLAAVGSLCDKVVLLNKGSISDVGLPSDMIKKYLSANVDINEADYTDYKGSGEWVLTGISLLGNDEEDGSVIWQSGSSVIIKLKYITKVFGKSPYVILLIKDSFGNTPFFCFSKVAFNGEISLKDSGEINIEIPKLPLLPGSYSIDVSFKYGRDTAYAKESIIDFEVHKGDFFGTGRLDDGLVNSVLVEQKWSFNG
jgi:lipopolysaccharide transport system ATP-binding protein